jgi:hypothetical protein
MPHVIRVAHFAAWMLKQVQHDDVSGLMPHTIRVGIVSDYTENAAARY